MKLFSGVKFYFEKGIRKLTTKSYFRRSALFYTRENIFETFGIVIDMFLINYFTLLRITYITWKWYSVLQIQEVETYCIKLRKTKDT